MLKRSGAFVAAVTAVDLGHCFVEPVAFDGEQWNVPFRKQFGSGGRVPRNWEGTGVMERVSHDRARYQDDGGAVVVFLPTNAPSVREVEQLMCR